MKALTRGCEMIIAERDRQIEQEGFDAKHDAGLYHRDGELAWAACYYAMPEPLVLRDGGYRVTVYPIALFPDNWDPLWAKRDSKDRISQLVAAGALIAAEIDRLLALKEAADQRI